MARNDGAGVTRVMAQHAASLAFDALPGSLVDLIKQIVLDTLGVAIGASGLAPEARIVADYAEALGGQPAQQPHPPHWARAQHQRSTGHPRSDEGVLSAIRSGR